MPSGREGNSGLGAGQSCDLEPISEARHESGSKWPCPPSQRCRQIWLLPQKLPLFGGLAEGTAVFAISAFVLFFFEKLSRFCAPFRFRSARAGLRLEILQALTDRERSDRRNAASAPARPRKPSTRVAIVQVAR